MAMMGWHCRNRGRPPTSIEERRAAGELVPAGALVFTDARTFNSEQPLLEQLLEKLRAAQEACEWQQVKWQVSLQSSTPLHAGQCLVVLGFAY